MVHNSHGLSFVEMACYSAWSSASHFSLLAISKTHTGVWVAALVHFHTCVQRPAVCVTSLRPRMAGWSPVLCSYPRQLLQFSQRMPCCSRAGVSLRLAPGAGALGTCVQLYRTILITFQTQSGPRHRRLPVLHILTDARPCPCA